MRRDAPTIAPRLVRTATLAACLAMMPVGQAGEADVVDVVDVGVEAQSGGTYRFEVTVRHADEGWEHYADRWEVLNPEAEVLGTRTLHHPHENEQPFTRSLSGVEIPDDVTQVRVRAHDSEHGFGGEEMTVELP